MARFRRTSRSGVAGPWMGDRLILADNSGLSVRLRWAGPCRFRRHVCPARVIRRADPNPHLGGCYSPYDDCAVAGLTRFERCSTRGSVNSEITTLTAMAARRWGMSAAQLLNGSLALHAPKGVIVWPARLSHPGRHCYTRDYRRLKSGYTALLLAALDNLNPFASAGGHPLAALSAGLRFPRDTRYLEFP